MTVAPPPRCSARGGTRTRSRGHAPRRSLRAGRQRTPEAVELLGVRIHVVDRSSLLEEIERAAALGIRRFIANVNVHAMNLAWKDAEFREVLNNVHMVFVDGSGVRVAGRLCGADVGERLTPADWIDDVFEACSANGWSIFWLGDTEEVATDFERELARRHPGCRLAGHHHGFFDKVGPESDAVVDVINRSGATVLLAGMSMPIQEKWLWLNRHHLRPTILLPVGGLARIYTGNTRRGPRWMTDHGLEWLFRLVMEPRHTWRRYLLGNPLFLFRVLLARYGAP